MVLFYVLIVCTVTLPPGVNPIAVDKYIYIYIYLASRSIGSRDAANGYRDREYYSIRSLMPGSMGKKALYYINVKFNNAMLFFCLLCLSVAFKFLNLVIKCYKSWFEHYDEHGGHSLITKWGTCELLWCEQYCWQAIFFLLTDRGQMLKFIKCMQLLNIK